MSEDRLPTDDEQKEAPKKTTRKTLSPDVKAAKELDTIVKDVLKAADVLAKAESKLRQRDVVLSSKIAALHKATTLVRNNF